MFSVKQPEENRVDLEIEGSITKEEMEAALSQLLDLSKDLKGAKMMYSIRDLQFPEFSAIGVELRYLPQLFSLTSKVKYAAFLTDSDFLEKIAEFKDMLFRNIEIKTFDLDEVDEAEAWLATKPSSPPTDDII